LNFIGLYEYSLVHLVRENIQTNKSLKTHATLKHKGHQESLFDLKTSIVVLSSHQIVHLQSHFLGSGLRESLFVEWKALDNQMEYCSNPPHLLKSLLLFLLKNYQQKQFAYQQELFAHQQEHFAHQ
jgi:hypothetical protein